MLYQDPLGLLKLSVLSFIASPQIIHVEQHHLKNTRYRWREHCSALKSYRCKEWADWTLLKKTSPPRTTFGAKNFWRKLGAADHLDGSGHPGLLLHRPVLLGGGGHSAC